MTEGLVTDLIEQLASIAARDAEQETRLVVGVDEEIQRIEGNLLSVKAVLNDAEKRQFREDAVKLWLEKLNNLCYEIEDVVDEWNTELIKSAIQKEEEENTAPVGQQKVCSFISSPSRCFDKLARRHDIAHKIKDLNGILDEVSREGGMYGFELTNDAAPKIVERSQTTSLVDEPEIYGRDKDRDELVRLLLSESSWEEERSPCVISVVGMGGIGKTTLAKLAYNDARVQVHFGMRGWVCVSDPFDQCRVARAIIDAFGGGEPTITELQILLKRVHEMTRGRRFFLVLDDVWSDSYKMWEPFRLALEYGAIGSKILVTTRNSKVVEMMGRASLINLEVLSNEDCWLVFSKIAFFDLDPEECEELEDLGRQLAQRCEGLPLFAKSLGALMRFKRSREEWKSVLDNNLWELEDVDRRLFALLDMYRFEFTNSPGPDLDVEWCQHMTTSLVDVSGIYGRDNYRDEILRLLLWHGREEERSPHVISLVGMAGIGKTTLAKLVFNDLKVYDYFSIRLWVCVSYSFDQCMIAKEIIGSSLGCYPKSTELQSLLSEICETLAGEKFFLVLDDVWTEDYTRWEPFRHALKCGAQGSRILVTTRNSRVARMMESASVINLEVLSKEDCWMVFSSVAFSDKDPKQCEQLEYLGRQIVEKCEGLPIVAKILGVLMRFKRSLEEWKIILDCNLWELEDVERTILGQLFLSYCDLSSPLKQCFLYCAVFPKDYVFSIDELVYLWMAQGYIKSNANVEMEIMAREYFEKLACRSFFKDFRKDDYDGKIIMRCKMHGIVHDFAQLMTKNKCFTINSDKGLDYKNARHLQLEIPIEAQFLESIYKAKYLRTLIFVYQSDYNLSLFHHLRCLRTLTLYCQDATFKELPDAVENFIHLRYLKLVNYHGDRLPETICNLCNLQTLEIIFCSEGFKKLPQGMEKLINLRHLILDDASLKCLHFPVGFGRLISLRTLSNISIRVKDDSKGYSLGELQNLNLLQGALQVKGLGHVVDACEVENAQLKKKTGLHTLKLWFNRWDCKHPRRENDALVLNALESPPNLKYLCIEEYRASTMSSNWMMSLTKLKTLFLKCFTELECLPPLGKLPFLESLRILEAKSLKKVGVEFLGIESQKKKDDIKVFPKLKFLTFERLWVWEEWIGIGGEEGEEECITTLMPHLQELKIRHCPKLKSLPDFLRTTPLKNLDTNFSQILKEHFERGTGEDEPKISHIPTSRLIEVNSKTDEIEEEGL